MTTPVVLTGPSAGALATAAFADNIALDVNYLLNPPAFSGYQTTISATTNNAWTTISIDTNVYDTYSGHSTTVNNTRYVAKVAGLYLIVARVGFAFNGTGTRGAAVQYNGVAVAFTNDLVFSPPSPSPSTTIVEVVAIQQMAVNDYIEIAGFQSSGGSLNTATGASSAKAVWIHA